MFLLVLAYPGCPRSKAVKRSLLLLLLVFLLTLPVTSASCERAHSKVDLVKSAVRASMGSERLEHLVLISSEKSALDSVNVSAVVRPAALGNWKLPLQCNCTDYRNPSKF